MKLLYVTTSMGLGGADAQVLSLARGMRDRGHSVEIVSLAPLGRMGQQAQAQGLAVTSLNIRHKTALLRALGGLTRAIDLVQPDVLHSHMIHSNVMARVSRLFRPVPVLISTGHSVREGGSWSLTAYRYTDALCDLTTNVSQAAVLRYRETGAVPGAKLRFMPNGLDVAAFDAAAADGGGETPGPSDEFTWIAVGRFEEAKDYPNLLAAFAQLASAVPHARLNVVGEGRLQAQTERFARHLGLEERVRFLGARSDVPALLARADAYVLSSAWEGLPMVLLEAGAARLPVVATDVGGNRDVVLEGRSGLLVPPRNPSALAEALRLVMDTPTPQRRHMGELGREHVQRHFGINHILDGWEAIYAELLGRLRGAA